MRLGSTTILILALIALGAFSSDAMAQQSLAGGEWMLSELNGRKIGETEAYIEFDAARRRISGNGGCNRLFGSYTVRGARINFSGVGMTRMACLDRGVMNTEAAFARALERANRYRVRGRILTLYIGGRLIVKLTKSTASDDEQGRIGLTDRKWVLEGIGDRTLTPMKEMPFLVFDAAKQSAGGNTGCNLFGGSFTATERTIRITDVISTMRACIEDDRMSVERGFLDGLQNARRYAVRNGKLYFWRGAADEKRPLLVFNGVRK